MNEAGQWHWEDYEVGAGGRTRGRTITEADIVDLVAYLSSREP